LRDIGIPHRSQIASAVRSMGSASPVAVPAAAPHVVSLGRQPEPKRERDDTTKAA